MNGHAHMASIIINYDLSISHLLMLYLKTMKYHLILTVLLFTVLLESVNSRKDNDRERNRNNTDTTTPPPKLFQLDLSMTSGIVTLLVMLMIACVSLIMITVCLIVISRLICVHSGPPSRSRTHPPLPHPIRQSHHYNGGGDAFPMETYPYAGGGGGGEERGVEPDGGGAGGEDTGGGGGGSCDDGGDTGD